MFVSVSSFEGFNGFKCVGFGVASWGDMSSGKRVDELAERDMAERDRGGGIALGILLLGLVRDVAGRRVVIGAENDKQADKLKRAMSKLTVTMAAINRQSTSRDGVLFSVF